MMRGNPLRELVPDEFFFILREKGFLNERAVRDYYMKKRFEELKSRHQPKEIFSILQREFPYLSEDTVRKIIYTRNGFNLASIY